MCINYSKGNINNEHGKATKLTTFEIHSIHMGDQVANTNLVN